MTTMAIIHPGMRYSISSPMNYAASCVILIDTCGVRFAKGPRFVSP